MYAHVVCYAFTYRVEVSAHRYIYIYIHVHNPQAVQSPWCQTVQRNGLRPSKVARPSTVVRPFHLSKVHHGLARDDPAACQNVKTLTTVTSAYSSATTEKRIETIWKPEMLHDGGGITCPSTFGSLAHRGSLTHRRITYASKKWTTCASMAIMVGSNGMIGPCPHHHIRHPCTFLCDLTLAIDRKSHNL